jgi:hypothetical protein
MPNREGDRRGSNPRPSEPQSADIGCHALLYVAESAYLSLFVCARLPAVAACCALGGVNSGVNTCGIRQDESWCTLPICCDGVPALATIVSPLLPHLDSVIRDVGYGLRRTTLPRTRVNRDQRAIERAVRTAATVSPDASKGTKCPALGTNRKSRLGKVCSIPSAQDGGLMGSSSPHLTTVGKSMG